MAVAVSGQAQICPPLAGMTDIWVWKWFPGNRGSASLPGNCWCRVMFATPQIAAFSSHYSRALCGTPCHLWYTLLAACELHLQGPAYVFFFCQVSSSVVSWTHMEWCDPRLHLPIHRGHLTCSCFLFVRGMKGSSFFQIFTASQQPSDNI